jgi:pyruvate/2-oxoglutarate dehydrogenase complex dihydrolipoamide acyltransferase (E2) component
VRGEQRRLGLQRSDAGRARDEQHRRRGVASGRQEQRPREPVAAKPLAPDPARHPTTDDPHRGTFAIRARLEHVLEPVGRRHERDRGLIVARKLHRPESNRGVHPVKRATDSRIAGWINDAVLASMKARRRAPAMASRVDGPHLEGHPCPGGRLGHRDRRRIVNRPLSRFHHQTHRRRALLQTRTLPGASVREVPVPDERELAARQPPSRLHWSVMRSSVPGRMPRSQIVEQRVSALTLAPLPLPSRSSGTGPPIGTLAPWANEGFRSVGDSGLDEAGFVG